MSTVHCFVSSPSGATSHLLDKFKELSEEVLKRPFTGLSGSIPALQDANIRQCVVSGSHMAFLLEDGRICRVGFSEKLPPAPGGKEKSDDDAASTSSARSLGSRGGSPRPEADDRILSSIMHRWGSIIGSSGVSGSRLAGRGRFMVRRRGAGRPLLSRWPLMPTVEVPEELVDQALAVLQGKSREVVTRELQRTNLDVNQAVNNLLSRDDDDGGREGEHEDNFFSFLHSGEELLNLLGSGSLSGLAEEELEDVLGRREETAGRESRVGMYDLSDPMVQDEIRSWVTLGDGAAGGSTSVPSAAESNKKRKKEQTTAGGCPFSFDSTLQWWPLEADQKFQLIAGLYSELIAVDNHGCLRRWLWTAAVPQPGPHPACERLQLQGESVRLLSARTLRASLVTESGKVATWVDDSVGMIGGKLEHPAQVFSELSGESVAQLHTCELFTAVLTESGKVFWWGVLPFSERKLAMMQAQDSSKSLVSAASAVGAKQEPITVGSVVCMRSKPIYCIGTKAIHIKGGVLQCGVLQEQVFSLLEKCRFKRLSVVQQAVDNSEGKELTPVGTKRKYSEDCSEDEEVWSLKDVVFIEDQNMSCLGTVVKLDGKYAAVHFPSLSNESGDDMASTDLSKCRLLRKDELMLVTDSATVQLPSCAQDCPKRLKTSSYHSLMTMACDSRGVHIVHSLHSTVRYTLYSLDTAKAAQSSQFSDVTSRYLRQQAGALRLWPVGPGNTWLLVDAMGGLYPLQKDSAGGIKDLPMLHLPPALDVGIGMEGGDGKGPVVVVAFRKQHLISALLHCDLASVKSIVEQGRGSPHELTCLLSEKCSGGCNIFHLLAFLDAPAEPVPAERRGAASRSSPRSMGLREMMRQASMLPSACRLWGAMDEADDADLLCVASATSFVEYLGSLEEHSEVLQGLLMEKNAEGFTPFMAAVACKAYSVATKLLEVARSLSKGSDELLLGMLYPSDSHPDDNPVFMLCRNDTCSFTWTGEEHIYQDIFECRTCGLTGSLCCCTECAYTCHRGHDCSFKRASPTAYCDCWEKCKCLALAPGSDSHRHSLLTQLLKFRTLSSSTNGRDEHLLEMLLGTVARQSKEQNQWHSMRSGYRHQSRKEDQTAVMPAHDLSPPQFARRALQMACEEWTCVEAALGAGEEEEEKEGGNKMETGTTSAWSPASSKQGNFVMSQASTRHLDALTYTLLCKTPQDIVDCLLTTLVKQIGPLRTNARAIAVTERFLRSVIRVLCVCHIEGTPSSQTVGSSKKKSPSPSPSQLADRIFSSLVPLAVPQLISQACTVLTPVCMGVCMPVETGSAGSDKHRIAEELFRLPQADLLRVSTQPVGGGEHTQLTEGVVSESESESGAGDGEESTSGGPAHDASSTATIGSNPLPYLSDQNDSTDNEELDSADEGSMDGEGAQDEGYVMVDAGMLHRPSVSSHWALPSTKTPRNAQQRDPLSMNTSAAMLAQIFSMLVRQASDLVVLIGGLLHSPTPPSVLPVMEGDVSRLSSLLWTDLAFIWQWLAAIMDSTEALVRLGCALNGKSSLQKEEGVSTDASRLNEVPPESVESRKAFLSYLLTLSRGSHNEHRGLAPAINVASMEHVAWCLDAMVYTLQRTHVQPAVNMPHRFFRRTNSTTCLGYPPVSPFAPLVEALPLADRPHLLHPKQCREAMFGFTQQEMLDTWPVCTLPPPPVIQLISSPIPRGLALQFPQQPPAQLHHHQQNCGRVLSEDAANYVESHQLAAGVVLGRWCMTVDLFSQAFADTTGKEKDSVLAHLKSFEKIEREFRREMEMLHSAAHRDIVVEVERCREKLLSGTFRVLNSFCDSKHSNGSSQPLCVHRIKVFFKNEPGEGSGVTRSLFTALSEALLSDEPLPKLDPVLKAKRPLSPSGRFRSREKQKSSIKVEFLDQVKLAPTNATESPQDMSAECPLFYQPGKPGFYSLRAGVNTPGRLNAFRNVGRILGLCMLFSEVLPIPLCRHIYKYLLHREISWHDLAFFDPVMYESMRKLIVDMRKEEDGSEHLGSLSLNFSVSLREEEGGGIHNLIPNGADCSVTPDNIFLYIQKYAELRMIKVHQEPLEHMRQGLHDVLAESSLQNLTAEDMRLTLCGCPQIDVEVLKKITLFNDESRKGFDALQRFKIWFWSVVERLSQKERQELLYFWTSSSAMPANADSYQPAPSVTLRPADDQHLPTANTCISRLYIPYYSSKSLLKAKVLMAIRTKTFGFV